MGDPEVEPCSQTNWLLIVFAGNYAIYPMFDLVGGLDSTDI